jgi:hypothetical protein
MTGYVNMSKKEFMAMLGTDDQDDIEVYIVNGGQQTRGIQFAIANTVAVKEFRSLPANYPAVTIYCGMNLLAIDFNTVRFVM